MRPVEIDAKIAAVLRDREMRANIRDFEALGARVVYRSCDMRNEDDVQALMDDLYGTYGRIDAWVHGAGVIEDHLLVNKMPCSVSRVFDTKVDSAYLVATRLRPESLRFVCFFTSVAGRYGNRGQTDYAAANETLNRYAWLLQAKWGPAVKVSAINWGPWDATTHGAGMVTAETRRQFLERGVYLVEPDAGQRFFWQEILYAPVDAVEVIGGESPWEYAEAKHGALPIPALPGTIVDGSLPLLLGARPDDGKDGGEKVGVRVLRHTLDLVAHPFLDHHRIDGLPVMPMAGAIETMAETVKALGIAGEVTEVRNLHFFRGLTVEGDGLPLEIRAREAVAGKEFEVELIGANAKGAPHYRATVVVEPALEEAPLRAPFPVGATPPVSAAMVYNRWLFHGPLFQTVSEILSLDDRRVVARLKGSDPRRFCPAAEGGRWLFDPGAVDGAFTMVLTWSRTFRNTTPLPAKIGRIRRFGDAPLGNELMMELRILSEVDNPLIRAAVTIADTGGRVRIAIEDMEGMSAAELNRLGGGWAGGQPDWMRS
jgi:NAD(P)-dependent dehydrogenase (short-subunit alcohol dehydrogenase family)